MIRTGGSVSAELYAAVAVAEREIKPAARIIDVNRSESRNAFVLTVARGRVQKTFYLDAELLRDGRSDITQIVVDHAIEAAQQCQVDEMQGLLSGEIARLEENLRYAERRVRETLASYERRLVALERPSLWQRIRARLLAPVHFPRFPWRAR